MKDASSTVNTFCPWGSSKNINSLLSDNLITKYDTSVISGGIGFHLGYRILFNDGFFLNFEGVGRNSWVNKKEIELPPLIKYLSFQPRFQIGYRF